MVLESLVSHHAAQQHPLCVAVSLLHSAGGRMDMAELKDQVGSTMGEGLPPLGLTPC